MFFSIKKTFFILVFIVALGTWFTCSSEDTSLSNSNQAPNFGSIGAIEICNDQYDNDLDGKKDCFDVDCRASTACIDFSVEYECTDNEDNDQDASVDCADPDCESYALCEREPVDCTKVKADRFEPNNDLSKSTVIPANFGELRFENLTLAVGDRDYYSIEVPAQCGVIFIVAFNRKIANIDLYLLETLDGDLLDFSYNNIDYEEVYFFNESPEEIKKIFLEVHLEIDSDFPEEGICHSNYLLNVTVDCLPVQSREWYCNDQEDNDNDGFTDCDDKDCWGKDVCSEL